MTAAHTEWAWQFGGFLHRLPPAWSWALLGAAAAAGAGLAAFSYLRTLRPLPPGHRAVLIALRLALLGAIALFLANPVRVEKKRLDQDAQRPLAVLVDRSGSMEQADNRSETRLHNAVRLWNRVEPGAAEAFGRIDYFRFSSGLEKASGQDEALGAAAPGPETRLYAALRQLLQDAPAGGYGGVVCLTDGLDTTGDTPAAVTAAALPAGTPLYFVVGANRAPLRESWTIREMKAPPVALRRSRLPVEAILDAAAARDGAIPVTLRDGETVLETRSVPVRAGRNVVPLSFAVTTGDPGAMALEIRAGPPGREDAAGLGVRVVEQRPVRILFYQGAMQWGYNFFVAALRQDPGFHLDAILHPAQNVQTTFSQDGGEVPPDLPGTADALKKYDIVVLAHAYADGMSAAQQKALADYARNGGGVLFVAPDDDSSRLLAGSAVEQMLPVAFEPPAAADAQSDAERRFRDRMRALGGSNGNRESEFAAETLQTQRIDALQTFALPDDALPSPVLGVIGGTPATGDADADRPRFTDYTRLRGAKAGAEVLAVHPTDRDGAGRPRVLMARQTFGRGTVTVMATDLLWRWKMSLPAESRRVETFWQQLLLALAQPPPDGLRFVRGDGLYAKDRPSSVRLQGGSDLPEVAAVSPSGRRVPLPVAAAGSDGWTATFQPDAAGAWRLEASAPDGETAHVSAPVAEAAPNQELSGLPPDLDGLRKLAEGTGGAVLEDRSGLRAAAPAAAIGETLTAERAEPLWDRRWLLALCLALYAAELLWRRARKLL